MVQNPPSGRLKAGMPSPWFIRLITGLCNILAAALGIAYGWLALAPTLSVQDQGLVLAWTGGALLLSYTMAPIIFRQYSLPIWEAGRALAQGLPVNPALLRKARQRTLNMPVGYTRISTIVWILSGFSFIPFYAFLRPQGPLFIMLHVVLCVILVGAASFSFVYYSSEWYSQRHLIPILFPEGLLSQVNGVDRVSTRFKILVLIATTCALPVVILSMAAMLGSATPAVYLFLGLTFLCLGLLQAVAISRSLTGPMGRVVEEMARVRDGDLSARAPVLSTDSVGVLSEGFNEMVAGLRRAALIRETFGRYVSGQVLEKILEGVDLSGEIRQATVLFSDIRGFTAMTENLSPRKLLASLNGYLDVMVDAVLDHGGMVDKFIGDSVMAVFGVPFGQKDHARQAVAAGLDMLKRLEKFNASIAGQGIPPWRIGIGIHSGEVIAGNIGSAKKLQYTVIGDVVNTASRIEQLTKGYGKSLLVSGETWKFLGEGADGEEIATVVPKGKTRPITIYNITGLNSN